MKHRSSTSLLGRLSGLLSRNDQVEPSTWIFFHSPREVIAALLNVTQDSI